MDHLGLNPRGEVCNGANDNASGTAVVMEIARAMKLFRFQSKRTIIFALWAGEEQGLLGSKHYGLHPLVPFEKTIVNLNMDMVGHGGKEKVILRGKDYFPRILKILEKKLPEQMVKTIMHLPGGPGGSDHTPFMDHGVPAFFIQSDGPHIHYHLQILCMTLFKNSRYDLRGYYDNGQIYLSRDLIEVRKGRKTP